jgi:hypothetical protein
MKRLVLLGVLGVLVSPGGFAQSQLAGDWQGNLDAGGTSFRVAWHVAAGADGSLSSTLDNIDESIYGIKAKSTVVKGSDITVTVDDTIQVNGQEVQLRGEMVGTVDKDATELHGTWTQTEPAQAPAPLEMKHAATVQPQIVGDWEGTLDAGTAKLRLVLHVSAAKNGALAATLDSLDQGANGIPVNAVVLNGQKLSLTLDAVHGTYEGTVNKDASEIDGTWTQTGPLNLNFRRAQPRVAEKPGKPSDIDGTWQGTLDFGMTKLRILFKIVNMESGLSAEVQSPDQSPNWLPTSSVIRSDAKLTIEMQGLGATFEGKISNDRSTVDGTFTQRGTSVPLLIKKS